MKRNNQQQKQTASKVTQETVTEQPTSTEQATNEKPESTSEQLPETTEGGVGVNEPSSEGYDDEPEQGNELPEPEEEKPEQAKDEQVTTTAGSEQPEETTESDPPPPVDTEETPVVTEPVDEYAGMSAVVRTMMGLVDSYIDDMALKTPGGVNRQPRPDVGVNAQGRLSSTLKNIFVLADAKDFIACMDLLVKKIRQHRDGVFHERFVFRFWDSLTLSSERRLAFEYNLSALLTLTGESGNPVNAINFNQAFPNLNEQQRTRMIAYFKRIAGN